MYIVKWQGIIKVLYVNKGEDEPLELLCMNPECISMNKVLNCVSCIEENHIGHQVIHYKKFINLLQK